jgi:hypothetical protein
MGIGCRGSIQACETSAADSRMTSLSAFANLSLHHIGEELLLDPAIGGSMR